MHWSKNQQYRHKKKDATAHGASPDSLYARIDDDIVKVINNVGWPIWHTPGGAGDEPLTKVCNFADNKLMWCARIDFRRGTAANDLPNSKWFQMIANVPGYRALLSKHQNPSSQNSMGNAMEMAVGLAYACHTNFVHLPDNHRIEFTNGKQKEGATQWAAMWLLFEHLGISATE